MSPAYDTRLDVLAPALSVAIALFLMFLFVRMAFDIKAVRTMLENQACSAVSPADGAGCGPRRSGHTLGHCGGDLDPARRSARFDNAQPNDRSE